MKKILILTLLSLCAGCSLIFDDLRIEGKWTLTQMVSSSQINQIVNGTPYDFQNGGTLITQIRSSDPAVDGQTATGTWAMDTGNKSLTLTINNPVKAPVSVLNYQFLDQNTLKLWQTGQSDYIVLTRQ